MPQYLYQLAYTPESLAAQMKKPQDRLKVAAKPIVEKVGGKLLGAGFCFGEYDVVILFEAADDETAAAVAIAVGAGGAIKSAKTTKLLTGPQWVTAMSKAGDVAGVYKPSK